MSRGRDGTAESPHFYVDVEIAVVGGSSDFTIETGPEKPSTMGSNTVVYGLYIEGQTQKNQIFVSNTSKKQGKLTDKPIKKQARTLAHELGHSGGLSHIWKVLKGKLEPILKRNEIKDNLMNSDANPDPNLKSANGTKVEDFQIDKMIKTATKQAKRRK
jgi:hypothetical protein